MNKKITLYELMGLVKDGQAPKRIKYKDNIYDYKESENGTGYVRSLNLNGLEWLANRVDIDDKDVLNDEVEILEEENNKNELPTLNDMKNIGNYMGKAYRVLFESFWEAWNQKDDVKEKKE